MEKDGQQWGEDHDRDQAMSQTTPMIKDALKEKIQVRDNTEDGALKKKDRTPSNSARERRGWRSEWIQES